MAAAGASLPLDPRQRRRSPSPSIQRGGNLPWIHGKGGLPCPGSPAAAAVHFTPWTILVIALYIPEIVPATAIPDGWMGLDVGPDCIKTFAEALDTTKTVIWNGPMRVFEFEKFAACTDAIAKQLAEHTGKGVTTIVGGGDSVGAVEKAGLADKMSHISTGGGASLELVEGKPLPGVLALDEA
ncbi:hypothetical protein ACQJBY_071337 [Aegilops geniculata]